MPTTIGPEMEALVDRIQQARRERSEGRAAAQAQVDAIRTEYRAFTTRTRADLRAAAEFTRAAWSDARQLRLQQGRDFQARSRDERAARRGELDALSREVCQHLSRSRHDRQTTHRELFNRLHAEAETRRTAWSTEHGAIQRDLGRARSAWSSPPPPPARTKPPAAPYRATTAEGHREAPDRSAHGGLDQRLLALINSHPEGLALAEMEATLEVPRIRLGQICRQLIDRDSVSREGKLYFPRR